MRINEAYEHEPMLPYQGEESCPVGGCNKVVTQCVDVIQQLELAPTAVVGTAVVACQGAPRVCCETAADGTACTVTITQRVCVTVPVRFGVTTGQREPAIACAETGGTTCSCGT